MQDRWTMARQLKDEMDISIGSIHSIMKKDSGFRRISTYIKAAND